MSLALGRVSVRSTDGAAALQPGRPLQIVVEVDAREPIRLGDLRVDISIAHPLGGQYVALSTGLDGGARIAEETISGRTELVCDLEGLPLKPGTYTVAAALRRHGEIVDRVEHAAELTLVAGPFFDSGSVPLSYPAPVLVRHGWSLGATAAGYDATTTVERVTSATAR
jgi:hypothetical protein